jgi:LacI family transcriptional regulator
VDAEREATLQDVARRAGVHASTASRSLDPQQAARIGAATRERVLAAARELNYQPHIAAGSLRSRRSRSVGVLVPDLSNPIFGALLAGISERLEGDGYTAIIFETRDDEKRMNSALHILGERRVDAVINAAARSSDTRRLGRLLRRGIPMVLAARDVPGLKVPRVLNDDLKGGSLAGEHLVELGHRTIAQISGPENVASFLERSKGFRFAVTHAAGAATVVDIAARSGTVDEGHRVVRALLRRRNVPTAIFAHNDLLAIGALAAAREAGLVCPDDLSVVGYNDTPMTEYLDPPLTTIYFPAAQIGRVAAETVLSILRGAEAPHVVALHPRLVTRRSTSAVSTHGRRVG